MGVCVGFKEVARVLLQYIVGRVFFKALMRLPGCCYVVSRVFY